MIKRRLRELLSTLHIRFLLALAITGILPLGVVGLAIAALDQRTLQQQSSQELVGLARGVAGELDLYVQGLLTESHVIANLPQVTTMDPAQQEPLLQQLFLHYPQFSHLTVFDAEGRRVASSHPGPTDDVAPSNRFQRAATSGIQSWGIDFSATIGRPALMINTPIRNSEREVVGVLSTVVRLANLSEIVSRTPVGGGGFVFVLDESGRVLLHPDRAVREQRPDYSQQGFSKGTRPAGPGVMSFEQDGARYVGAYAPAPNLGWTVVVQRSEQGVIAPIRRSWYIALIALALSTLLALGIAALTIRQLTRPLRQLASAARALGAGDPTAPLPDMRGDTSEVGTLVRTFDEMRSTISAALERERSEALVRRQAEEALREQAEILETINRTGSMLSAELELQNLLQALTDAATELSGGQFGAFFYNTIDQQGERYMLYTVSGVPRSAFENYPMPRNTAIFGPTFRGEKTIRLDDVTKHPNYGKNSPYNGLPPGHLPVRSYMAIPVVSRSGEVLGGLFFGHSEPGVFTERNQRIVEGLASQTAIAIDNARLYQESQQSIRTRDQFISLAAHELKTPMTAILGNAQLLQRRMERAGNGSERDARIVQTLIDQVRRLHRLSNSLLDLSRIQQGHLTIDTGAIDVCELVQQIAEEMVPTLSQHTLSVSIKSSQCCVLGDRLRLEQVLQNLINNAVKYSPDGGTIEISVEQQQDVVQVAIKDQGIGIPAGEQSRIFERFYRARNINHEHLSGMGVGLFVVKEIISLHGGTIEVDSVEGEGSTFTVQLPVYAECPASKH